MINYKGTPLLGEDSNPQHTSEFFAIAGTVLFWLLFTIFSFVIKPQPENPKYKEVQIVLSSTPVVQKTEEAPAPAEAASASAASSESLVEQVVETPAVEVPAVEAPAPKVETPSVVKETPPAPKPVEKTVETPKPKAQPKPEPKKETPKTQTQKTETPAPDKKAEPVEPITYAVDPMEAFAAQTNKKAKKEIDWDAMFADDEPSEVQTANQVKTVTNKEPAFSGTAGTADPVAEQKVTSSTTSNTSKSQSASSSTSSALEGIKNSSFKGSAANGVQSETSVKSKTSGSGKVEMEMSNGRSRALISPAKPVINLSAQAAATIDSSITVTIKFRVVEAGNVPRAEISITPESTLHQLVRDEIRNQISTWRFEPADYAATATFEYKIVKQ